MAVTTERYINLFTDFGFKKLFGDEPNKDLLISFINSLLVGKEQITDLSYLKNERIGKNEGERRAVYDLYCSNQEGDKFIVEIQRVNQEFIKDRSIYYSTFAVQEQALKGKTWNYELKSVYTIAVLDFEFSDSQPGKVKHHVKLLDIETKKVFYNKLNYIYLEIPKFHKEIDELENDYEKWLFAFKNLHKLRKMPKELEEGVFKKLFELAEIAKMKPKDRTFYEDSLKDYWDLKNSMETYFKEGMEKGMEKEKVETAKVMIQANEPIEKIVLYTGLSREDIAKIKSDLKS